MIRPVFVGNVLLSLLFELVVHAAPPHPGAGLELSECRISAAPGYPGVKARCGILLRHLDPADPQSPLLNLNVAVVPALNLNPEADPLVAIAGGPGGASTTFYAGYEAAFEKVRRNRDIVLLDQRGTGKSEALTCDLDEDAITGQFSAEETAALAKECLDALPYDPRFFTTSVAVRDLEALRLALGYPAFNIYGISYGTRVAQHYARRYPQTTRSVILDGVVPPQIPLGPGIAIEAQNALQSIFDRCAQDPACNDAFPDLEQEFRQLRQRLSQHAAQLTIPDPVTGNPRDVKFGGQELAVPLRLMSYDPATVALMPLLIHQAATGNIGPLAATFLNVQEGLDDQIAIGMHNAVVCTEDVPFFDDPDTGALAKTYIGTAMIEALGAICSVWPAGILDDDLRVPLNTDKPVLLLSGSADPVTPPRFASLAAIKLSNSRELIGEHQGHGQAARGCVPDIIGRFVETASIAELDTDCMQRLFTMPFFLDFSGPAP